MNGGILKMNIENISNFEIDLGASGSRCVTEGGKIFTLPNNMVMLNTMEPTNLRIEDETLENNLEVKISKTEGDNSATFFPTNVLIGTMAEKHRIASERPSMNLAKHKQKINYVSTIVSCAIDRIEHGAEENMELFIAVPPIEVYEAEKAFETHLVGKYEVEFPRYKGGIKTVVNIVKANCYEESLMALTSFLFNMNGTVKESSRQYIAKTILSLDIGASTSDVAIMKNGRYIDKSGRTWKIGGNIVRDAVIDMVSQRYGIELSFEDADIAVAEGRIQQGVNHIDISEILHEAKYEFAKALIAQMQAYFKRIGIDINSIHAIVISGGGSVQSQYVNDDNEVVKTSEPMSFYVTQELKQWAPGIIVIHYGEEPRFANAKGLFIKAMFEKMKRAKESQASVAAETSAKTENNTASTVIPDENKVETAENVPTNTAII